MTFRHFPTYLINRFVTVLLIDFRPWMPHSIFVVLKRVLIQERAFLGQSNVQLIENVNNYDQLIIVQPSTGCASDRDINWNDSCLTGLNLFHLHHTTR